ncbi:nucleotidyl transferase AbiEii/AbiGii toxin family protein [Candidatus Pacearchaeota archaeon]|nr:nucleotidyl transferase AbiEii/AbiGii toxin family protein [Candidatus Pacearchaeota archaeon]
MITREELSEASEKRKIGLYYAEKEYLQYIFLNAISKYSDKFSFKGGTCLRICYGLDRASEDLDFSSTTNIKETKEIVNKCSKEFEHLNINHQKIIEKEHKDNIRFEIRFEGPLFSGNPSSTNTLKIDFNKQKTIYKTAKVIQKVFSDVPMFVIMATDEKEILAEKIRTLANRKQSRDLYDIWMLISKGVTADKKLINQKLKEENSNIKNITIPSKEEYELDLKNLVTTLPPYEQVKTEVMKFIESLKL